MIVTLSELNFSGWPSTSYTIEYLSWSNASKKALVIPIAPPSEDPFKASWVVNVTLPLAEVVFPVIWRDIESVEFDKSTADTFLFGNFANNPELFKLRISGFLTRNVGEMGVAEEGISPLIKPVTELTVERPIELPSGCIEFTLLKVSNWTPLVSVEYPTILSVFNPTWPENLLLDAVAVALYPVVSPTITNLSKPEKFGKILSCKTESAANGVNNLLFESVLASWYTDLISSVV